MKSLKFLSTSFRKSAFLLAAVLIYTTGVAQTDDQFSDWDADEDMRISKTEFNDRYSKVYVNTWHGTDTLDIKAGDKVDITDENSFYESSYGMWDANRDQHLDENEWNYGYESAYGDYLDNDFDAIDVNRDSYLDYDEYYNSLYETDFYSSWDTNADSMLDDREYSEGVFDTWDENDDDYIDENEYEMYSNRYLDNTSK